jgi:hypothetical protein
MSGGSTVDETDCSSGIDPPVAQLLHPATISPPVLCQFPKWLQPIALAANINAANKANIIRMGASLPFQGRASAGEASTARRRFAVFRSH